MVWPLSLQVCGVDVTLQGSTSNLEQALHSTGQTKIAFVPRQVSSERIQTEVDWLGIGSDTGAHLHSQVRRQTAMNLTHITTAVLIACFAIISSETITATNPCGQHSPRVEQVPWQFNEEGALAAVFRARANWYQGLYSMYTAPGGDRTTVYTSSTVVSYGDFRQQTYSGVLPRSITISVVEDNCHTE